MDKAMVFDIQKFSVHDGPGIRTVVFLKGCPMKCWWCANPESQSAQKDVMIHPDKCIGCGRCTEVCDHLFPLDTSVLRKDTGCTGCGKCAEVCPAECRVITGREMTAEEVIYEAMKDEVFYRGSGGGITFSGGEAVLYPGFIAKVMKSFKEVDLSTAVETCGDVPWENYETIIPYLDTALFDLKIMDSDEHRIFTGRPNERILENVKKLSERVNTIVRMPIIPGINDTEENIQMTGEFIRDLDAVNEVHILPYHNFGLGKYRGLGRDYVLETLKAPENEDMEQIKTKLDSFGLSVQIGG